MSAIEDLLKNYQHIIAETTVLHGDRGIFDVLVDGDMLYSCLLYTSPSPRD